MPGPKAWLFLPPGLGTRGGCRGSKHTPPCCLSCPDKGPHFAGAEGSTEEEKAGEMDQESNFQRKESLALWDPKHLQPVVLHRSPHHPAASQAVINPEQNLWPLGSTLYSAHLPASVSTPLTSQEWGMGRGKSCPSTKENRMASEEGCLLSPLWDLGCG